MPNHSGNKEKTIVTPTRVNLLDRSMVWLSRHLRSTRIARADVVVYENQTDLLKDAMRSTDWRIISLGRIGSKARGAESHVRMVCEFRHIQLVDVNTNLNLSIEVALAAYGVTPLSILIDTSMPPAAQMVNWPIRQVEADSNSPMKGVTLHASRQDGNLDDVLARHRATGTALSGSAVQAATTTQSWPPKMRSRWIIASVWIIAMIVSSALIILHNGPDVHGTLDFASWNIYARWSISLLFGMSFLGCIAVVLMRAVMAAKFETPGLWNRRVQAYFRRLFWPVERLSRNRAKKFEILEGLQMFSVLGLFTAVVNLLSTSMAWHGIVYLIIAVAAGGVLFVLASFLRVWHFFARGSKNVRSIVEVGSVVLALGVGANFVAYEYYRFLGVPLGHIDIPQGRVLEIFLLTAYKPAIVVSVLGALWYALRRYTFAPMTWLYGAMILATSLNVVGDQVADLRSAANHIGTGAKSGAYGMQLSPVCVTAASADATYIASHRVSDSVPLKMWEIGTYGSRTILAMREASREGTDRNFDLLYVPSISIVVRVQQDASSLCASGN